MHTRNLFGQTQAVCGSFGRSSIKWDVTRFGSWGHEIDFGMDAGLRQRRLKTVYPLADIIHVAVALVPTVVKPNLLL